MLQETTLEKVREEEKGAWGRSEGGGPASQQSRKAVG